MIELKPPFRMGKRGDGAALAELVNFAGYGLPAYLWDKMKAPGETAMQHGRVRAERETGSFSHRNAVVAEMDGRCVACLIGYSQPEEPEPIDYEEMPPMFVPLQELENLAPGTWYVNVLAAYPEYRGRGLGSQLLGIAEDIAREERKSGLSLIVSDGNPDAQRLYLRRGYREAGARPKVKEGWESEGRNWVLLTKPFGA
jgi:ribosomal protein S18 acetylase RimI-like enzyme